MRLIMRRQSEAGKAAGAGDESRFLRRQNVSGDNVD